MPHSRNISYQLRNNGEFVVSGYNSAKPFSSFFPGVAGQDGLPMWTFYVNRGQCICSMGVQDKDHAIMEFYPANQAYQMAPSMGFRTFLKFADGPVPYYEPFQNKQHNRDIDRVQEMRISSSQLVLEERNKTLGLTFVVEYCNVPNDEYAGLIRRLQIRNDTNRPISLSCLDGIPLVVPAGVDNSSLKFTRRLVEAFVEVDNLDMAAPMFRGKVEPVDRPEVVRIRKGNFYLGFLGDDAGGHRVMPVVDPVKIFGSQTDYSTPDNFLQASGREILEGQIHENRYPCAMGWFETEIPAGGVSTYTSIIGHASSVEALNAMAPRIANAGYTESKFEEDSRMIEQLLQPGFMASREQVLDQYARQNFQDNGLRGGLPISLEGESGRTAFYMYSRKHGDLERDYNHFSLSPSKYSQGNANYRDVNQNRRNDLFFNPDIHTENVEHFYNLIQLDGFNPLVIKEVFFRVNDFDKLEKFLARELAEEEARGARDLLREPFTPGLLMKWLDAHAAPLKQGSEWFIGSLLGLCDKVIETEHGEGFWTDHWVYNLDLLENYLALYPEETASLLFEKDVFTFYDNAHRVLPRDEKYVLWEGRPMQLSAVVLDPEKESLLEQRSTDKNVVRTNYGRGDVYRTTLFTKILSLVAIKLASLDPQGVGVEMEADKPNWYDALNGLPGIMGSSLNETLEIKRNLLFLKNLFATCCVENRTWRVYEELAVLVESLQDLLAAELDSFTFWDRASAAKETYREATRLGVSGEQAELSKERLEAFLEAGLNKLDEGIEKAWDQQEQIPSTYFINAVEEYRLIHHDDGRVATNRKGLPCFRAETFSQKHLPLFLEGPVHYLRTCTDKGRAAELAMHIKRSDLFDRKLQMYKVNAPLGDQPMEIGRARIFSPGWFENESIWLHMEYKYMLELLRNELFEEFYADFKNVLVPFFDPAVYGRSILENSSFIVSSANPDPSLHGNGFVARLSGATAEFIHMMLLMTVGRSPFSINESKELQLTLQPGLSKDLFCTQKITRTLFLDGARQSIEFPENSFSFMFLGSILVTYLNPTRQDTFGGDAVAPVEWTLFDSTGGQHVFLGRVLPKEFAEKIRSREIRRLVIELR